LRPAGASARAPQPGTLLLVERFDGGERSGVYLKPMVLTAEGNQAGGELIALEGAGAERAFRDIDAALRRSRAPLVFTPPVFAGDAVHGSSNRLFAIRALRAFVAICLAQDLSLRR